MNENTRDGFHVHIILIISPDWSLKTESQKTVFSGKPVYYSSGSYGQPKGRLKTRLVSCHVSQGVSMRLSLPTSGCPVLRKTHWLRC